MRWDEKPREPSTPFDENPIGSGSNVSSAGNAEGEMEPVALGWSFAQALGWWVVKHEVCVGVWGGVGYLVCAIFETLVEFNYGSNSLFEHWGEVHVTLLAYDWGGGVEGRCGCVDGLRNGWEV